jgi:hypothetical protein
MGDSINDDDLDFIRLFLADKFAGVEFSRDGVNRIRKFPISDVRRIFFNEISVAFSFNLMVTTPEFGGFDPRWVRDRISRIYQKKNASLLGCIKFRVSVLIWGCFSFEIWLKLRKALLNS